METADGVGQQRSDRADLDAQLGMVTAAQAVSHDESARQRGEARRCRGHEQAVGRRHDDVAGGAVGPQHTRSCLDCAARADHVVDDQRRSTLDLSDQLFGPYRPAAHPGLPYDRDRARHERGVPLSELDRSEVGSDDDGIVGQLGGEGAPQGRVQL